MGKTRIEWTEFSWNPIRARLRLGTGLPFKPGHREDIDLFLDDEMLLAPLKWRRPRMVSVCSMTDLFADFVPDAWIDRVFAVMALSPQHTFQVLTKRAAQMREYTSRLTASAIANVAHSFLAAPADLAAELQWPLPNVWLGVSCERQQEAEERIPVLLAMPAAVRFVSLEPLLGPIDIHRIEIPLDAGTVPADGSCAGLAVPRLDWVIVGGESGPNARPMHQDWARSIRDQCTAAGVAFFFKQWGAWWPDPGAPSDDATRQHREGWPPMARLGKARAGRLLDGREWNEMPMARPEMRRA